MPWRWRSDGSGTWHHVMSRGLARRTVLEDLEGSALLSVLPRAIVRRGLLRIIPPRSKLAIILASMRSLLAVPPRIAFMKRAWPRTSPIPSR